MPEKNRLNLIVGLSFIAVSFLCVGAVLYVMGNTNLKNAQQIAYLQTQLANLIGEKAQAHMSAADFAKIQKKPVELADVLSKSENVYNKEELTRKEGVFWVDRAVSRGMVTLGAANGLKPATRLSVYDGDRMVGELSLENIFDVVSYVKPVNQPLENFGKDYYRAVVKE